jgi:hypothetical protein
MFVETGAKVLKAPEERHVVIRFLCVAPSGAEIILCISFYKHIAPRELIKIGL